MEEPSLKDDSSIVRIRKESGEAAGRDVHL